MPRTSRHHQDRRGRRYNRDEIQPAGETVCCVPQPTHRDWSDHASQIADRVDERDPGGGASAEVTKKPFVLIGTLAAINSKNQADGPADAFWICLAVIVLETGKIVSKANTRAWRTDVDTTPTQFFADDIFGSVLVVVRVSFWHGRECHQYCAAASPGIHPVNS